MFLRARTYAVAVLLREGKKGQCGIFGSFWISNSSSPDTQFSSFTGYVVYKLHQIRSFQASPDTQVIRFNRYAGYKLHQIRKLQASPDTQF
ncbi:hypothetical protein Tco_1298005 [Tanacetum coccineum]